MRLDAIKRLPGRPIKDNSVPVGQVSDGRTSREVIADNSPDSNTQIQRYIRLTELVPEIRDLVDEGKIALRPAVELSYLSTEEQQCLTEQITYRDATPSHVQAIKMREIALTP